jgi:hypothetical protein
MPWTRRVLGLFVVMGLNLALQPCAMAMGVDDEHDCPRCPTSHTSEHVGHDMASHGNTASEMPCATGADDCSPMDTLNVDGRVTPHKVKDLPSDQPVAILSSAALLSTVDYHVQSKSLPRTYRTPGNSLPLNILYCVYLK